jgi:hypothetical protein
MTQSLLVGAPGKYCIEDFVRGAVLEPLVNQVHDAEVRLVVNRTGPDEVMVQPSSPLGTGAGAIARLLGHSCFGSIYYMNTALDLPEYLTNIERIPQTTEDMAIEILPVVREDQLYGAQSPCPMSADVQQNKPPQDDSGLSDGAVAGIIVSATVVFLASMTCVVLAVQRHRRKRRARLDDENSPALQWLSSKHFNRVRVVNDLFWGMGKLSWTFNIPSLETTAVHNSRYQYVQVYGCREMCQVQ